MLRWFDRGNGVFVSKREYTQCSFGFAMEQLNLGLLVEKKTRE